MEQSPLPYIIIARQVCGCLVGICPLVRAFIGAGLSYSTTSIWSPGLEIFNNKFSAFKADNKFTINESRSQKDIACS